MQKENQIDLRAGKSNCQSQFLSFEKKTRDKNDKSESLYNTKIEAVIGPRMSNQNMILFSFVVQHSRFSKMMRMTTHDETNMKGNPINQI